MYALRRKSRPPLTGKPHKNETGQEEKEMTAKQMDNRVKKLQKLESQIAALTEQAEEIKAELKQELESMEQEEVQTSKFRIRWKYVIGTRFDSKALKSELPDVYERFTRLTSCRRFSVA